MDESDEEPMPSEISSCETTWPEKREALLVLPNVTSVRQLGSFVSPMPGKMIPLNGRAYLVTKSPQVDGIVLAVAPSRSHCAVIVEGPADTAVAIVAWSPTMLDTLLPPVSKILGPSYVPHASYVSL